jgi:ribose 5-phosphate isomerase A
MAAPRATGRQQPPALTGAGAIERQKQAAAEAAAAIVQDGMRLGLGTGSTVAYLLPALAQRGLTDLACVATSPATASAARELGLRVLTLDELGSLDLAIDGADQVDPRGWLIKGGGGAHTREKIVAVAATRFVVIVSSDKVVARLRPPVPLELVPYGVRTTLARLEPATLRDGVPASPDGGVIADYRGPIDDPLALATRLSAETGVVEHGLFSPAIVSEILIAADGGVERRTAGGDTTAIAAFDDPR